ncbi:MAG: hypothetical protein J2P17_13545 [Mycobacterium sp.]|nr:hypothetical protein [Mycobacterium sp.]
MPQDIPPDMPQGISQNMPQGVPGQEPTQETYNPWTLVNVAFNHLVDEGLHPTLGEAGHPGDAAEALLCAFGITPTQQGDARMQQHINDELAALRARMLDEP